MHAGGTAFTRFQNVTLEAPTGPAVMYPARLAASTAATLGTDLTLWLRPWFAGRLDFIYAPSNFELRLSEEDRAEVVGEDAEYRSLDYSDLSLFALNLAFVLALPIKSTQVAPYALLGGGMSLLLADDRGANGLEDAFDGGAAFDVAGIAGVGLKIPLTAGRVSLSFELIDRITPTPIEPNDDRVLMDDGEFIVRNRLHPDDEQNDTRYTHAIGIAAGLSFATGGDTPSDAVERQ